MPTHSSTSAMQELVSFTASSRPQIVALRFGRRIHELQHRIELAWLTLSEAEGNRISDLWQEVRLLSRGLTTDELKREEWAAKLQEAEDFWTSQFQSEWHVDLYYSMRSDLGSVRRGATTFYGAGTYADVFRDTLTTVLSFVEGLSQILIHGQDCEYKEILSFGYRLDQIVHLRHPHRHLRVMFDSTCEIVTAWDAHASHRSVAYEIESPPHRSVPDTGSINELRLRWRQLGFPESVFPEPRGATPSEFVNQIQAVMESQLGSLEHRTSFEELGSIGLIINGIQVQRRGYQPIEVRQRLRREIIRRLAICGRRPTSYQDLEVAWEGMGGNQADPEPETIRGELSRIRPVLRSIGLEISNVRNVGWRLEEIEGSTG